MNRRLLWALAGYAAISLLAWRTLDGNLRILVWIIMAAFAIRTWAVAKIRY